MCAMLASRNGVYDSVWDGVGGKVCDRKFVERCVGEKVCERECVERC